MKYIVATDKVKCIRSIAAFYMMNGEAKNIGGRVLRRLEMCFEEYIYINSKIESIFGLLKN